MNKIIAIIVVIVIVIAGAVLWLFMPPTPTPNPTQFGSWGQTLKINFEDGSHRKSYREIISSFLLIQWKNSGQS